ncbi:hypothetical protein HKD37_18G050403 [Glycine soja]
MNDRLTQERTNQKQVLLRAWYSSLSLSLSLCACVCEGTLGIIGIVSELYSGLTSKISSPIPIKIDETRVLNPPSSKPSPLLEFQATKSSKERSPTVTDCRSRRSPVVEALDSEGGSGDLLGCC